jgi:hypothetical protein
MFKYVGVIGIVLGTLAWLAYLEVSPRLGNIWLRQDAEGNRQFSPGGLKALLVAPWYTKELWSPSFWDVNPWVLMGVLSILGAAWPPWASVIPSPELPLHPHVVDKRSQ